MLNATRTAVLRYGFACLTVAAALLLRLALWPLLGSDVPFLFLLPAVMYCAWYGGAGPGLLATLLSGLAGWCFLLEPQFSLAVVKPADVTGIFLYLSLGAALSKLIAGFHRAKRQVEQYALDLFDQREWFRVTLASIADAVIATDPEGRVVFMNEIAEHLTGWTAAQGEGQPLEKVLCLIDDQTRVPGDNPVHKVLQTGGIVGLASHTILLSKRGTEFPIDDTAAPICNEQGRILGVVLVFRDVSQQRRLENELHRHADELVDADRQKNEFLASLAHELRNFFTPIQYAIQLVKCVESANPHILQATDVIDQQTQTMKRLVEDLLDTSRISQGKVSLRKQPVDLREVVRQAVETSRPSIDARQHKLTVNFPAAQIWLDADPARLIQVVVNLLNNAAKYTDAGGQVALTLEQRKDSAILRVRDNGIGISSEMLPHVFDRFTQSRRALGRSQGGLGIGLMLVRSFVEMHGGTVQVFSDGPGKGSEFVLRLPIVELTQESEALTVDVREAAARPLKVAI